MGSRSADKVKFTSYDELFGGEKDLEEENEDRIVYMLLQKLHSPQNHPFRVVDDEKMMETVESIKKYGVLVPAIVRYNQENECDVVSGNRRKRGCELAGLPDMPVIIRRLSDDEATIIMVDSNMENGRIGKVSWTMEKSQCECAKTVVI